MSLAALLFARGTTFERLTPWQREELQDLLLIEYLDRLDAEAAASHAAIHTRAREEAARLAAGGRRRYVLPRGRSSPCAVKGARP